MAADVAIDSDEADNISVYSSVKHTELKELQYGEVVCDAKGNFIFTVFSSSEGLDKLSTPINVVSTELKVATHAPLFTSLKDVVNTTNRKMGIYSSRRSN